MYLLGCLVFMALFLSPCYAATGTISFTTTQVEVKEIEDNQAELLIRRTGGTDGEIDYICKILNSTGNVDFHVDQDSGVFKDGETQSLCTFYVKDDNIAEGNETFVVQLSVLSALGSVPTPSKSLITIVANDDAYGVVAFDVAGDTVFNEPRTISTVPEHLPLLRQIGSYGDITVQWRVLPVAPGSSNDITPSSGVVNFRDGEDRKNLEFSVHPDEITEGVEEFTFELVSVSGGARLNSTLSEIRVKISANDIPLRFALDMISVPENQSQVIVWVYRGLDSTGTIKQGSVDSMVSTASWYLKSGGATVHQDFNHSNGTVVFGKGDTKKSFRVDIIEDTVPEPAENFTVELTSLSPDVTLFPPSVCTIQILPNDDHSGVFELHGNTSTTISEDGADNSARITIERKAGTFGKVEVSWRATTLLSGMVDLTNQISLTNGTIVFNDGDQFKDIIVGVKDDSIPEEAFSFTVELTLVTGGGRLTNDPGRRRKEIRVQDSDDVYGAFEFADDSQQTLIMTTTQRMVEFVVTRTGGDLGNVVVGYEIQYLSPDGIDLTTSIQMNTSTTGSVAMTPGQRRASVAFSISQDVFIQASSVFKIRLTSANLTNQASTLLPPISPRLGLCTVLNLTVPAKFADGAIGFERTAMSVTEPDGDQAKLVHVSVHREGTLTTAGVSWSMDGGGANDDVRPSNGTITFEKGVSSVNISLEILPDSMPELDETFNLQLHNVSGHNHKIQSDASLLVLTILSNDNPGGIFEFENTTQRDYIVNEPDQFSVSVIRLDGDLEKRLVKIEATTGKDQFLPGAKILSFAKGEKIKTQKFFVNNDDIPEINMTVTFRLLSFGLPGQRSKLGDFVEFNVTILGNDDPHGIIMFQNTSLTLVEGKDRTEAHFGLERRRGLYGNVTVFFNVTSSSTSASLDVTPVSGHETFKDGEQFESLGIYSLPDNIPEGPETFTIELTGVTGGAKIGNPSVATLTIPSNDDAIEFEDPVHVTVAEGNSASLTIVRRGNRLQEPIYVNYTTVDGSAISVGDADYTPAEDEQIYFPPGTARSTISISVLDDDFPEGEENFTVVLTSSTGDTSVYGKTVATVTIEASDDPNGIFNFDPVVDGGLNKTAHEGETVSFRVTRYRGAFGTVGVHWQIYQKFPGGFLSPLTTGRDFEQTSGELVFTEGVSWRNLELKVLSDRTAEYGEMFEVVLVNTTGGRPGPGGKLASNLAVAYINIPTNDYPYGLFAFSAGSLNTSVAEDTEPGFKYKTIANMTVVRQRGTDRNVWVSWCIYKLEDADTLGDIWDLIFLSKIVGSIVLVDNPRRSNTGSDSFRFFGAKDSYAIVTSVQRVPTDGFTISAWLIPDKTDQNGTILAKVARSSTSYKLLLDIESAVVTATLELQTSDGIKTASANINSTIFDSSWHNLIVTIHNESGVVFYYDGDLVAENRSVTFSGILDYQGDIYLGASSPNKALYKGTFQDVKIFTKVLQKSDIKAIAKPVIGVKLISGYLRYRASVTSHVVSVTAIDNDLPEDEKVFSVILNSPLGGASVDDYQHSRARLIVSKSDNANGLFQFGAGQSLSRTVKESVGNVTIEVVRLTSYYDQVTITWEITHENGSQAVGDFVQSSGNLVFNDGERTKNLIIQVRDEHEPELAEKFTLRLVSARSDDGKDETTPTSGASINEALSTLNITIEENDYPYGLLQFSGFPGASDTSIVPLTDSFSWDVRESSGTLKLYIVRAQGKLGDIQCSWKTVPGTALENNDFVPNGRTVTLRDGETSVAFEVNIVDNDRPELNKTFGIELYGATNRAKVGPGGNAVIQILPSDDAFGVVNFTSSSLSMTVHEGQTFRLELQRTGGALGPITISWQVDKFGDNLMESSGEVSMSTNQRSVWFSLTVMNDTLPELSQNLVVRLTNVTSGRLASTGIMSMVTVVASDDPYGVFEFQPVWTTVHEANTNVTLSIVRRRGGMGDTRVYYTSVPRSVVVPGLVIRRAEEGKDYRAIDGYVDFQANQTSATVVLEILDDVLPEGNETVFVNLTSVVLTSSGQSVPRIGVNRLAEVIILQNDNATGIVQLSSSNVEVTEGTRGAFIDIVRTVGTFGEVTISFEVISQSAKPVKDYAVTSNTVTIVDGHNRTLLPISIVDDNEPELNETFIVRLLPKGDVLVGSPAECLVTITKNDYPYGLIGFDLSSLNNAVSEPSSGNQAISLTVVREFGTLGLVRMAWNVTLHGRLATSEVMTRQGKVFMAPGENETSFDVVILSDTVPEVNEVLSVTLEIIEGKAEPNTSRHVAYITILQNDDAHGIIEFSQDQYHVKEKDQNTTVHIPIVRRQGTHGELRVYYSTLPSTSSSSAVPYQDYEPLTNATAIILDGANTSTVDVVIVGDSIPELGEWFGITLERAVLVNDADGLSQPLIGPTSRANITIDDDDNVYGLFKVFAQPNVSRMVVNETGGLAVKLDVRRDGGSIGDVNVDVIISSESTATNIQDFRGSDVILSFGAGDKNDKPLTITIEDDDIPERDETIIIKLVNPTGGAAIVQGPGNNVTIVIQANDVVAGKIGFNRSSRAVDAKEGDDVILVVTRSAPAAGSVIVDWMIEGVNVSKDFNETRGRVHFSEGENVTYIRTRVLADNTSETDEKFQVVLSNPVTSGISRTGRAEIDDLADNATITVGASDEPHGVLEFQQSSRRVTVREDDSVVELSVARLFGNIGTIRVYFSVLNGSLQSLDSQHKFAIAGEDAYATNNSVIIENGINVGVITVNIGNDNIAELNEIFLVNITAVELVVNPANSSNNSTFSSPRLGDYLTSEVTIEANDGPYGILVFSPSRVSVLENITVFNLTVLRDQGTFGEIQVSYYIRKLNIQENDFNVYGDLVKGGEATLQFVEGQRTQNITVFVYDDTRPEGDETFQVYLKNPTNGAKLGSEAVAHVTILVSDAGNGIFKFDPASLRVLVDEPGNKHVGTTQALFTVLRTNGTIGDVVLGWSILNQTEDFRSTNGTVVFKDGQRKATFIVETVVDLIPEKEEEFLVQLSVLSGGGEVTTPSQAWLVVTENEAPYGEFGFAVQSPNILSVEETVGFTDIKVLRRKGTYGRVTVDYHTTSQSADSSSGDLLRFAIFQSLPVQNAQTWFTFSAYGKQFLLVGSSSTSPVAHPNVGSSLYQWKGVYTHVTDIPTNNAVQWESFAINGQHYIAVANQGAGKNREVNSAVYKFYSNGTLQFHQNIPTKSASSVKFFTPSSAGSTGGYLVFSNMENNNGNTDIRSQVYQWNNGQFRQHGLGLNCRGASGLALFTITDRDMLAISSYYDSVNNNYLGKSTIFEWKVNGFQLVQEISTNGSRGVEYFQISGEHFLVFANTKSSPALYKWNGAGFQHNQTLPVVNAEAVKPFSISGEVSLIATLIGGNSQILKWNIDEGMFNFYASMTTPSAANVQPITVQDPVTNNVTLLAVAMVGASESRLLQPAMMSSEADFISRRGQLIFENDDTELNFPVTIFNDSISEPDETFSVSLRNPTGGSIVGPDNDLQVKILSNGNPYGRIAFAPGSASVVAMEKARDYVIHLEVVRQQGMYGEVVVQWNTTGNATSRHSDGDVIPTFGEIVFAEGQTRSAINLTVRADDIPEVNEVVVVRLTQLKKDGSDLPNKGATISSTLNTATVLVPANDEPHGIVGWRRTVVLAQESTEVTNSTALLVLERRVGTIGDIEVSYRTVLAVTNSSSNEKPAVPDQDFVPVVGSIFMNSGQNITNISIHVVHDNNAELNEIFFVNITNVRLLHPYTPPPPQTSPRIDPASRTAKVIISENDNKRGELNFNTSHLIDPSTGILRISENIGVLSLQVVRTGGLFGTIGCEYRLVPETPNTQDYFPTKGKIIFQPNETSQYLRINISDDKEAEIAERFRVEMTSPIGGAKLGRRREVSVEIRASDQPYGVFEFSGPKINVVEEGKIVDLTVTRLQGKFGEVHVNWNLSVGAYPDVYPPNGTLIFDDNVTSQVIRLRARDDDIPEGDMSYVCHLVSADNGGVIGSEDRVTLRIDANDDGYGVMAIDPATSLVYVGEPNLPSYDGQVTVSILRNAGTFGNVVVDWEIKSHDLPLIEVAKTFNVTKGMVHFGDGVKIRNVTLQVTQDTDPEETSNYTFSLTGSGGARTDHSASKAVVVVVSSDNPYGIIDFDGASSFNITEDHGPIALKVIRNKGHSGKLLITMDVATTGATEGKDFLISPKVLTIDDKKDTGMVTVTILPEAVPELVESFTVSLGKIQLVTSHQVDYGYRNGLQVDMPPEVGDHGKVVVTIFPNDDPHGVIEFEKSRVVLHEHDGSVVVSVIRTGGDFGRVRIAYTVTNITAQEGQDYIATGNMVIMNEGQRKVNITIPLLDDVLPEDREVFRIDLSSVDGGARLGDKKSVEIVIETSDNPYGLFGFVGQRRLVFSNPNISKNIDLEISRIGGARSEVLVSVAAVKTFPTSAVDISSDILVNQKTLTFPKNDSGPKQLKISILPFFEKQEVEEHFVLSIISVSGNASIDSLTSNVTLVVLKHGMPNGLFAFSGDINKVSSEGSGPVVFTVKRTEGSIGTVDVSWVIAGVSDGDFVTKTGRVRFLLSETEKPLSITIVDDAVPELDEVFTVMLVSASGGGDIDSKSSNATITIKASDDPHGRFGLRSGAQRVTVQNDLSRTLEFTVERSGGLFGEIRVSYSLTYSKDYPSSLNGHVTIGNGQNETTRSVVLHKDAFLYASSHFTLTLTSVSYQGSGETGILPSILQDSSTQNISVPDSAANAVIKFKDGFTKLRVDKDNQVERVVITRDGFYGSVTVFMDGGFPKNQFPGFTPGTVSPSVTSVTFDGNEREKEFSVQVSPELIPKQSLVYAIYLSHVSTPSNIHGGSRIDLAGKIATIESGGVLVMAPSSQGITVNENERANIVVYRLFSSLGTISVNYSATTLSKASPGVDFKQGSSQFSMAPGEYRKEISIDIIDDNLPELDEAFRVTITGVSGADARLGPNTTSNVIIRDNDSPYGVLSFNTVSVTVLENVTTVNIVITRSGGTFGNVDAQVRTIGGGETWPIVGTQIEDVLSKRNKSKIAHMGTDYFDLNTRVNFKHEQPPPANGQNQTVQLRIVNDNDPERDEEIFLYLSDPSGGAVLASSGSKSWAVVTIEGNDLFNGKISFVTHYLAISEDKDPRGTIVVMRSQSMGVAKVKWEAVNSGDNLVQSNGVVVFPAGEDRISFEIQLVQDKKPELQSDFTVRLVSLIDTQEASIDPTKNSVEVTLLPSDDPSGLIGFKKESRNPAVDVSTRTVTLNVVREQGQNGRVTVSYKTTMLVEAYTDGELVINRAVAGDDYTGTQGTLVFDSNGSERSHDILIRLTPSTASKTSYPKAFNVTLYNVTGGARLNDQYSTTMIIISDARVTNQFLQLRSDSLKTPLSDAEMARITDTVLNLITQQQSLSGSQVSIIVEILNNILDDIANRDNENDRKLSVDLSNQLMTIFDTLLDPERGDLSGKSQMTEPFVKYAFALVHGEPCPGTTVVKKSGKHAMVEGRRRFTKDINSLILRSSVGKNYFTYPSNIYEATSTSVPASQCDDVHFIEYFTDHWFAKDANEVILNNRVLSTSVKNKTATSPNQKPSTFRVYADGRVTSKNAECLKWRDESWDSSICYVKDETEEYVECECRHFSNFAVGAESDSRVGYEFYFYIAAFICMISFFLVIVSHHTCSIEKTFSSKLLMHMFFAGFALHLLVIVAAYIGHDLMDKPKECATLGILIHYFLLAQFSWVFVQCCNLWRILVLNDERTDRKFILYFMLGWGLPVVFVALYMIITHALYSWDITETYADVHGNGDMCFIRNAYGALASVLGPILLFLLSVAVVSTQAYQVTLQWKLYDDIFRGHHNIKEVVHLWIVFAGITLTWLFAGLHLVYGKLWLAIIFAIFEALTGLYVFMVYFVLRNQCRRKYRPEDHLLNSSSPSMMNRSPNEYLAERPVMWDAQSEHSVAKSDLRFPPPPGNEWDLDYEDEQPKNSTHQTSNDHAFAEANPLYDEYHGNRTAPVVLEQDVDEVSSSQDLGDLIFALKTGESWEGDEKDDDIEMMKNETPKPDKLELRRVSIADTHV